MASRTDQPVEANRTARGVTTKTVSKTVCAHTFFMKQLTLQETFNIAVSGLLVQGRQSKVDPEGSNRCLYHAPNGDRCAVGQLIPKTILMERYEGLGVPEIRSILDDCGVFVDDAQTVDLLVSMQTVHDKRQPEDWPAQYTRLAIQYGLSTAVIEEFTAKLDTNHSLPLDTKSNTGDPSAPAQLTRRPEDVILQS